MIEASEMEQEHSRDDIFASIGKAKALIGVVIAILVPLAAGAWWVFEVDQSGSASERSVAINGGRLNDLERWQIKADAERFTAKEAGVLSNRLSSLEQSNAEIYRTLQRIDSKLP